MNRPDKKMVNLNVLVVEDDKDTREILRFILGQESARVMVAGTVPEAIEAYQSSPVDVLIADLGMPGANGYALIALIRAYDKQMGRRTPAIALTAFTSPADRETALAAGFQVYMSKPFDPANLIETIAGLMGAPPRSVATTIKERHAEIMRRWFDEAHRAASARGLPAPAFHNLMPKFLSALALNRARFGRLSIRQQNLLERHLSVRIRQGFDLAEIIEEIEILGRVVAEMWESRPPDQRPDAEDIQRFFGALNAASTLVAEMFRKHMLEDEQTEKRYARLLQQIASEALGRDAQRFRSRLVDVVRLIMEAMRADAAALLLLEPGGNALATAASVGVAEGVVERYPTPLDPATFVGHVAAHEEPTAVSDPLTAAVEIDEALKRKGVRSLLGVRIPALHGLKGVLYVGMSANQPFSARDLQSIETLAERLELHLDNATLYASLEEKSRDLEEKVHALTVERAMRERYASILSHDLLGPLNVARMASALLMSDPQKQSGLASKINISLDRAERMIRDLLDASRIRANERLSLHLDECVLANVARGVIEELAALHEERFVLRIEEDIHGIWDAEQLRRAIWNLATNAVKYGDPDRPVTIRGRRDLDQVEVSVHNYGAEIGAEAQARLFDPFSRATPAQTGGKPGWGLGLTIVRGCAEAHGGSVSLQSNPAEGTTFFLRLPLDSRPYQPEQEAAA